MAVIKWWYRALYSKQIQKKNKTWTDGYIYYLVAIKKAVLLDEHGRVLESLQPVNAGDLQGDRELIMESCVAMVDGDPIPEPGFNERPSLKPDAVEEVEEVAVKAAPITNSIIFHALLYTKDKQKKAKKWHDGHISYDQSTQLAMFYDDEGKMIHKKKCDRSEIEDGSLLESGLYMFEVSNILARPPGKRSAEVKEELVLPVEYDCDLVEDEPCFELLYTEDIKKKAKKWKDGYIRYCKSTSTGHFFGEDGRMMFKRNLAWRQIDQQEEIATGRFILQIGAKTDKKDSEFLTAASEPAPTMIKRAKMGEIGSVDLSASDLSLFIEHEVHYTTDTQRKTKRWSEGHLWYDSGSCKVFDEDGKQIFMKKMASEEIKDGSEIKSYKFHIVIGSEKHRHTKDPIEIAVPEETVKVLPKKYHNEGGEENMDVQTVNSAESPKQASSGRPVINLDAQVAKPVGASSGRSAAQLMALFGKK